MVCVWAAGVLPECRTGCVRDREPGVSGVDDSPGNGKDFTVEAKGVSEKNIYVTAATLNGKPLERSWLRHREIMAGGMLVLTMSDKANEWGQKDVPPSVEAGNRE